ncbi:hypothetical protein FZC66_05660 [Priestia megaterium]|nr:hypothetical protein FZC66_05660 [Priestia megaterium]
MGESDNKHRHQDNKCNDDCKCKAKVKSLVSDIALEANICPECNPCESFLKFKLPNTLTFKSTSIAQPLCHKVTQGVALSVGGTGILNFEGDMTPAGFILNLLEDNNVGALDTILLTIVGFSSTGSPIIVQIILNVPDRDVKIAACTEHPYLRSPKANASSVLPKVKRQRNKLTISRDGRITERYL